MKGQLTSVKTRLKMLLAAVSLFICLVQLTYNLSQGYIIVPPFELDTPVKWAVFQSEVRPIAISYPASWIARNLFQGNHGDEEVIGLIRASHHPYPYVLIAHSTMRDPTLEKVAAWGESRILESLNGDTSYESSAFEKQQVSRNSVLLRDFSYTTFQKIDCHHAYLFKDTDAYTIEMCVDDKVNYVELEPIWEQMITSLTFND